MAKQTGWYLDKMPEKIMALAGFHGNLLTTISSNPAVVSTITNAGARLVSRYFEAYIDHLARANSNAYHHIYEFGMSGNPSARLFKGTIKNGNISYSFIDASMPNNNGQMFPKKAFVMEEGTPLDIFPRQSQFLVYDLNGETIFSKHSHVENPGGEQVEGAFQSAFTSFFNSNLPERALKEFGFYNAIEDGIRYETQKVFGTVNSGNVSSAKSAGQSAAERIARKVDSLGN